MIKTLKNKNIETFLVDFLIILTTYFVSQIQLSSIVYFVLISFSYLILIISKKPPKNFFLIGLYALAVILPVFAILGFGTDFLFDINADFASFSTISILVFLFTFFCFLIFIFSVSKKNKAFVILQTYFIPILFTVLILSTNYIAEKYSSGFLLIVLIYIPLRFLMAYKEPVKWYQFISVILAMYVVFNSAFKNENTPINAVKYGTSAINAKFSFALHDEFNNTKIIKLTLKDAYNNDFREGEYFFAVTDICNNMWRLDINNSIDYNRKINNYSNIDSIYFHKLFVKIKYYQKTKLYEKFKLNTATKSSLVLESEYYCDSALTNIKYSNLKKANDYLIKAEKLNSYNGEIYYLKALLGIENEIEKDSICCYLEKAVEYYEIDALQIYKNKCLNK